MFSAATTTAVQRHGTTCSWTAVANTISLAITQWRAQVVRYSATRHVTTQTSMVDDSWHAHFAGRKPVRTKYPTVLEKHGSWHVHRRTDSSDTNATETVAVVGAACSEIFSGPRLAKVLQPASSLEQETLAHLYADESAPALSMHTSAAALPELPTFLGALKPHLPWARDAGWNSENDWFVSLQLEGASAVWAACDLLLQYQHSSVNDLRVSKERIKVAVGARSYHGPGSSSLGATSPFGIRAKPMQVEYPVPSVFARYDGESQDHFESRIYREFESFLDEHGDEIGVMLIEPQWGSSCAAQPWNPTLLRKYVVAAKAHGILICADEIMCGLARHGQGFTFLSEAWGLEPDAVTFGKAVAAGVEPLSGVALRRGAEFFEAAGQSVLQMHTYAGASARGLLTGTAVLNELPLWYDHIDRMGRVCSEEFRRVEVSSDGTLAMHGQGLMWGGIFQHPDPAERARAVKLFQEECITERVAPYFIPASGFMFTPVLDITKQDVQEACSRLASAAERTAFQLTSSWGQAATLSMAPPQVQRNSQKPASTARYNGPDQDEMTPEQQNIYEEISRTRTTGVAGPFGPWLANPALADPAQKLGRVCRYETTFDLRLSELAILATAKHTRSSTEWDIHLHEARKANLSCSVIHGLEEHGLNLPDDTFEDDADGLAVFHFARELLENHSVSDATYTQLQNRFGDRGCVDLVGIVGYYTLVAMTLNTFQISAPEKRG